MLQRGVMAACGSKAIWATRHCPALRPFGPANRRISISSNAVAEVASATLPAVALAFKANLDFKFVKDNLQLVADNCKLRNTYADPARVVQLYDEFARLKQECDSLRASRNENSAAMKVGTIAGDVGMRLRANVPRAVGFGLRTALPQRTGVVPLAASLHACARSRALAMHVAQRPAGDARVAVLLSTALCGPICWHATVVRRRAQHTPAHMHTPLGFLCTANPHANTCRLRASSTRTRGSS